jgi:glycosyltransferase involved in cell wall biosynthesis
VSNAPDRPVPRISVVINCAYGIKFLREAIDSVFAQTFTDWELVFIDNCSTDGSAELAKSYLPSGRLRYVRLAERIPLYAARNVGLDNAKGEFVAFHDADDVLEPQMLEQLLARMKPDLTFVYGGYRYIDAQGRFLGRDVQGRVAGDLAPALMIRAFVAVGCLLLRREATREIRFDPGYNIIGDFDMWQRLSAAGRKCDYADAYLTRIRVHGGNMSLTLADRWIGEERRFYRSFIRQNGLRYPTILLYIFKVELSRLLRRKRI